MDLTFIHETDEAEMCRQVGRICKLTIRIGGALCLGIVAFAVLTVTTALLLPPGMHRMSVLSALSPLIALPVVSLVRWSHCRSILKMWRRRSGHRDEYRLTDEEFAMTGGAVEIRAKWLDLASHYLIDDDALYLFNNGVSAVVVPQWSGRGVSREELAAVLEKAGVAPFSRKMHPWRRILSAVLAAILVAYGSLGLCATLLALREMGTKVELERRLLETVLDGGNENPFASYWDRLRCPVRGWIADRLSGGHGKVYEKYEYIFDPESSFDKVGLVAFEKETVRVVFLPCNCLMNYDRKGWENHCPWEQGVLFGEDDRAAWLEKVRPLADDLADIWEDCAE